MNALSVIRPCFFRARLVVGVLVASFLVNFLSAADTPSLIIGPGQTKTLADLTAAGVFSAGQLHFQGDPSTDAVAPARLVIDRNWVLGGAPLIIGSQDSANPQAYAGGFVIADGKTAEVGLLDVRAGSRFTSTGGALLGSRIYAAEGSYVAVENWRSLFPESSSFIQNTSGTVSLRYTQNAQLMTLSAPFIAMPTSKQWQATTSIDVAAGKTLSVRSSGGVLLDGGAMAVVNKTGGGTFALSGSTGAPRYDGVINLYAGTLTVDSAETLGAALNNVHFKGNIATDATAPTRLVFTGDATFKGGVSAYRYHQLQIGDYDTVTKQWTAAYAGGVVIAEGKTVTLENNKPAYGADAMGGALLVGAGSRFTVDGPGRIHFKDNLALGYGNPNAAGGAIYAAQNSTVSLTNALFTGNRADYSGGAIYNDRANLTLRYTEDTTILDNYTTYGSGGFLYMRSTDSNGIESGTAVTTLDVAQGKVLTIGNTDRVGIQRYDTIAMSGNNVVLNKTGQGVVLLNSDTSALRGTLNVDAGIFFVNNAARMTQDFAINVAAGATFGGSNYIGPDTHGTYASATVARGGRLLVGFIGAATPAALEFRTLDLSAGGAVLDIDLFGPGQSDRIMSSTVKLNPTGPANFINLGGVFSEGSWAVIEGGSFQGATTNNINNLFTTQPLGRYLSSFSLDTSGTGMYSKKLILTLSVDPTAATLITWTGNSSNRWEASTLQNWKHEGLPNHFMTGDRVLFDGSDTANMAGPRSITVATPSVLASDLVVAGSADYTFTGGGIETRVDAVTPAILGAAGKLIKSGTGTLTLLNGGIQNFNNFTGGIDHHGGTIAIGRAEHLGAKLSQVRFLANVGMDSLYPTRIAILPNSQGPHFPETIVFDGKQTTDQRLVIGDHDGKKWTAARAGGFTIAPDRDLIIRNNYTTDATINGGAIQVGAGSSFIVEGGGNFVLERNKANQGGAIHAAQGAAVSLLNTHFGNNSANREGGAIYNHAATVNLTYNQDSTISGNSSGYLSSGFLYMDGNSRDGHARTTINVTGNATVTIGSSPSSNGDGIASADNSHDYNTFVKTGSGNLIINSYSIN